MKLNLLSPERRLVTDAEIDWIKVPGAEGELEILPGYTALLSTLETGPFSYQASGQTPILGVITSGFLEVMNDVVTVMAETVELKEEINVDRAKRAQALAEQELGSGSPDLDEHAYRKYQLKLERALIRQQVASSAMPLP